MVPPLRASTDGPTQFSNGKRLPDLTFLQDFLALFFEYKDEDRFRDDHLFERALHAALISVRAVALNKDSTGQTIAVLSKRNLHHPQLALNLFDLVV